MSYQNVSLTKYLAMITDTKPTPGGGSVAAYAGALGSALAEMVISLTLKKKPSLFLRQHLKHFRKITRILTKLSELDSRAYDKVTAAYRLPNHSVLQKQKRKQQIQQAMKQAAEVPYKTLKLCLANLQLMNNLIDAINPNALTDLGVGVLLTSSAFNGCLMNVQVNLKYIKDKNYTGQMGKELKRLEKKSRTLFKTALRQIRTKISSDT